jgi:hypothetical protein
VLWGPRVCAGVGCGLFSFFFLPRSFLDVTVFRRFITLISFLAMVGFPACFQRGRNG